uniref:Hairy-related 8a n=1 Tax=Myripristis murdjan TaxID=586833 RepID=A0A668ADV2_9TELE
SLGSELGNPGSLRKPLIEKRRRERINSSLDQLKGIMVDAYNLDHSKLEKADVLEITVQHMEGLQKGHRHKYGIVSSPGDVAGFESRQRYSSGYIQCMHEVHNLLLSCPGMDKTLGARLLNHLLKSLPQLSCDTAAAGGSGDCDSPGGGSSRSPESLRAGESLSGATSNFIPRNSGGSVPGIAGCGAENVHPPQLLCPTSSTPTSPLSSQTRPPLRPRRLKLHDELQTAHQPDSSSDLAPPSSSLLPPTFQPAFPAQPPVALNAGDSMWRPW